MMRLWQRWTRRHTTPAPPLTAEQQADADDVAHVGEWMRLDVPHTVRCIVCGWFAPHLGKPYTTMLDHVVKGHDHGDR